MFSDVFFHASKSFTGLAFLYCSFGRSFAFTSSGRTTFVLIGFAYPSARFICPSSLKINSLVSFAALGCFAYLFIIVA